MPATAAEDMSESLTKASPRTRVSAAEAYNVFAAAGRAMPPASSAANADTLGDVGASGMSLDLDADTADRVLPVTWVLAKPMASGILVLAVLASAATYLIVQFRATGTVIDGGFVGLLLSGVFTGFSGLFYIHRSLRQVAVAFFVNLDAHYKCKKKSDWLGAWELSSDLERPGHSDERLEREAEAVVFMSDIFNTTHQLIAGAGAGFVVASMSMLLEPWAEHQPVQRAFFGLIFAGSGRKAHRGPPV